MQRRWKRVVLGQECKDNEAKRKLAVYEGQARAHAGQTALF